MVAHREYPGPVLLPHRHVDSRLRGRVHERVAQQVVDDLVDLIGVRHHRHRALGGPAEGDHPLGRGHADVAAGVVHDRPQVNGGAGHVAHLVEAGEQQQVVDEETHAPRRMLDPAQCAGQVLGIVGGPEPEGLGVAADRRQRGAQLVGGVSEEAPHAPLARLPLGEGPLDLREHRVERHRQAPHLGALIRQLDALGEVAGGDHRGGAADPVQRAQARADRPRPQADDEQQGDERHQPFDEAQAVEDVLDGVQRHRGDDQLPGAAAACRATRGSGRRC